ncbi:MAG: Tetratricopeptide 2 repeat protein [Hyphomicrobiales bacterium]|nr:Tetratricopeptide 2 repeat protein [Hyphomicrobiales bacterium]
MPFFKLQPTARAARARRILTAGASLCALLVLAPMAPAGARESRSAPAPFEVGLSPSGSYLAALVAGAQRDTQAASTYFREALRADPRNPVLIERAFVASLSNGDMTQAFDLAERLVRFDAKNGLAQLALGVRAIKTRNFATARTHLARGGNTRRGDITAILLTAWTWAGSGDYTKALEAADRLNDKPFALFRDYHAALIADLAKRPQEAAKRMQAAYAAERTTLRLVDAYARMEARQGRKDEALKAYRAFDEALPRHPVVVDAMRRIEANEPLEPLIRTAIAGAGEVLYGLGAAGVRQGDELAAIIYLRLALHLAPDHGLAIVSLGDLYERIKQGERAIDVYEMMPEDTPLRASADLQIGLVLESLERKDEAQEHLEAIIKQAPDDPDALLALANLQRSRKLFKEAAETYTKALGISKKPGRADWTTYYFRGVSYERSKEWPKAEADFKKALELFPDQPLVLNYLGYSWVDRGLNLEEAFRMLRRAVDLRPDDGYIVDSLGWAFYRLGKYEEALRELERAIELKPSDPVINDHLGDVYWKVGRKLDASFQWNHARDLNPEPEDLPKILRKIEAGLEEEPLKTGAEAQPATDAKPAVNGGG